MSLIDELEQAKENDEARPNKGCYTCRWIATLSQEEQQKIQDYLQTDYSRTKLWQVLCRWGLRSGKTQFFVHLRGMCSGLRYS